MGGWTYLVLCELAVDEVAGVGLGEGHAQEFELPVGERWVGGWVGGRKEERKRKTRRDRPLG